MKVDGRTYFRICPNCGGNLDPGERCDCRAKEKETAPLPRETASGNKTPNAIISVGASDFKMVVI